MAILPPPPLPADTDLRSFPFMPLDVGRLRDSDLAAKEAPDTCWYAVLLWCAAWHQVPAASLPDDDQVLAHIAGFGRDVKRWKKHRIGALRGFVRCADGRLYHSVLVSKALDATKAKMRQRFSTEVARIKKHNQRHADNPEKQLAIPTFEEFCEAAARSACDGDVPDLSLGTAEGQGKDVPSMSRSNREEQRGEEVMIISPPSPSCAAQPAADLDAEFADWWSHYPRKLDRLKALKAYRTARRKGVTADELKLGVMRYAAECDRNQTQPSFIKHGASWLNAGSWENAPTPPARAASPPINPMLKALFSGLDPEAVR